jgi:hypothetical protein
MAWDNFHSGVRGPRRLKEVPDIWLKDPPRTDLAAKMTVALKDLALRLQGKKNLAIVLREGLEREDLLARVLALYCLEATDAVDRLLEALADEDPTHLADRDTAVFVLQRWLSRGPEQAQKLYDEKNRTGFLIDQKYRNAEAKQVVALLHDFPPQQWRRTETFDYLAHTLENSRVAIAELGFWHLRHLAGGVKLPPFNAAAPQEDRKKSAEDVRKLVSSGKLPPPLPRTEPGKEPGKAPTGPAGGKPRE